MLEFGRSNKPLERIVDEVEAILDHEREERAAVHQAWLEEDRPGTAEAAKAVLSPKCGKYDATTA
jgi:hypothetical protein